jgi:hypothetical protein
MGRGLAHIQDRLASQMVRLDFSQRRSVSDHRRPPAGSARRPGWRVRATELRAGRSRSAAPKPAGPANPVPATPHSDNRPTRDRPEPGRLGRVGKSSFLSSRPSPLLASFRSEQRIRSTRRGSILDAVSPAQGGKIARRNTPCAGRSVAACTAALPALASRAAIGMHSRKDSIRPTRPWGANSCVNRSGSRVSSRSRAGEPLSDLRPLTRPARHRSRRSRERRAHQQTDQSTKRRLPTRKIL